MAKMRVVLTAVLAPPVFAGAALSAGAAVAAHFGRTSLKWDILTHFAPLWLAGSLLALILGVLFRGYARALILGFGLVGTLAAAALIAPEYLRDSGPTAPPDAPGQIKVIQFNTWARNVDVERTVAWLIAEDPDIVSLQEASESLRAAIEARTDWHASCFRCDEIIYSKRRPVSTALPQARGWAPITRAVYEDAEGPYAVIGVHYVWPTEPETQQMQEQRLARAILMSPSERTIVTGDLNSTPWSFSRRNWDESFGLIRRDRALWSWPAMQYKRLRWLGFFPFLPIDHVYAGEAWATVAIRRGPKLGSDHYPIVTILAPRAPR